MEKESRRFFGKFVKSVAVGALFAAATFGVKAQAVDTDGDTWTDAEETALGTSPTSNTSFPRAGTWVAEVTRSAPNYWYRFEGTDPALGVPNDGALEGFDALFGAEILATDLAKPSAASGLGNALEFTGPPAGGGTQKYVDFGAEIPELINYRAAMEERATTVEYWIKTTQVGSAEGQTWNSPSIMGRESPADGDMYWGFFSGPSFTFSTSDMQEINLRRDAGRSVTDGAWHHIVLVKDWRLSGPSVSTMYVDGGARQGGVTITRTTTAGLPSFQDDDAGIRFLGFTQNGGTGDLQYIGQIDEVSIYPRALTEAEVRLHFAAAMADIDGDGLSDAYEDANGLNKNVNDAGGDLDSDGLTNIVESQRGTNPQSADTDNDGLRDNVENNTGTYSSPAATGTNPVIADTDGDGLLDGVETNTGTWVSATDRGTNPHAGDSDGDSLGDAVETNTGTFVSATDTGTNPNRADSDGDGFDDPGEIRLGSNPNSAGSIPAAGTWVQEITRSAPSYWWRFNESDPLATSENLGSVEGFDAAYGWDIFPEDLGKPTPLPGAMGTGIEFTGPAAAATTGKYVDLSGEIPELINRRAAPQNKSTTVEYWIKTTQAGSTASQTWTSPAVIGRESGGDGDMFWGWINAGGDFGFSTSDFTEIYSQRDGEGFEVTDGRWHHVVLVKEWKLTEPSRSTMYIDGGGQEGGVTITRVTTTGGASFQDDDGALRYVGFTQNGGGTDVQFIGQLDELVIYNRALSEAEVRLHWSSVMKADADNDGIRDVYEVANGLNPAVNDASADPDNDRSTNLAEYNRGTNPQDPDTDDDGLLDGVETDTGIWVSATDTGTDPFVADTDDDGLRDGVETNTGVFVTANDTGTNPHLRDTDNDGFDDAGEIATGSNPNRIDSIPQAGSWVEEITRSAPKYWWRFNETDPATMAENSGTAQGFDAFYGPGILAGDLGKPSALPSMGTALEFTGPAADVNTTKYVDFVNPIPELNNFRSAPETKATSVEYWIRTSQRGSTANQTWTSPSIFGYESPNDGDMFWGWINAAGDFGFSTSDIQEIFAFRDGGKRVTDGQWHHIVLIKEWSLTAPSRSTMYIDGGANEGGATIVRNTPQGNASFQDDDAGLSVLGRTGNGGGTDVQYIGLIDEVAIYDRVLSEAEVRLHYRSITRADTDNDGIPDSYEIANGFNPNANDSGNDADNDASTNLAEFQRGTNPNNPDTDGDGVRDGAESDTGIWVSATNTGSDPLVVDSDGDGIPDGAETNTGTFVDATNTGTNPNKIDSDSDGFLDTDEIALGTNPSNASSHTTVAADWVSAVQLDAPKYFYRFEETTTVAGTPNLGSVEGFDGTFGAALLDFDLGKESAFPSLGKAIEFTGPPAGNGTQKFVDFGAGIPELINIRGQAVDGKATTVEYWIKTTQRGITANQTWTSPAILANESGGDGDMYWGWFTQDGRYSLSTSDFVEIATPNVNNGEWHHIVLVKIWNETTPSISKMFIDGGALNGGRTITATTPAGAPSQQDADGMIRYLGFTQNGGGQNVQYIGLIDELAIYDKAFLEANAWAHYKAAGGGVVTPPQITSVTFSGGNITITWEGNGTLKSTTDLNVQDWQAVTPAPTGNTYTTSATSGNRFFIVTP